MATNQSAAISALVTQLGINDPDAIPAYEGLWHRYWNSVGTDAGTYDERMLSWLNAKLGESYTDLPSAMQAYAENLGYYNWDSIDTFDVTAPA